MQNKIALITGAGRGIGRATAKAFSSNGDHVAITARTRPELDELASELTDAGGQVLAIADDLEDRTAPARIVGQVKDHFGPVDILINNAGIGSSANPQPLVEFDDDFWDTTLLVNVTAPYLLTKLVLPPMIERHWGRIINIASINARVPNLHAAAYTTSKHALVGLTKTTALELAEHGITANAICPGVTQSRMNDKRMAYDAKRLNIPRTELEARSTPLGRRLQPDEIAGLAVYLASDAARAVNGQAINVCGGMVMW